MNTDVQIMLRNALEHIQGREFEDADGLLQKVLNIDPENVDALRFLSVIASMRFDYARALKYIDQSISLAPNNAYAYSNKGNILKGLERYEDALIALDRSIQLDPNYAEAYNNRANAMQGLHQYEEALDWYEKAIAVDPAYVDAYSNKGNTLEHLDRHEEAMQYYDKATAINPGHIDSYWAKSMAQLSRGNFGQGWQNYEARWFLNNGAKLRYPEIPRLETVENLIGKSVLVWAEQGFGDTFQFCRYIKLLVELGAKVTFVIPNALMAVLGSLSDICTLVSDDGQISSKFDFHSPLLSLPLVLGTSVDSIPAEIPYLFFDEVKRKYFEGVVKESSNIKVGLIWNGGFRANSPELWAINRRRNIELDQIAQLRNISGIDFYSLQKGDPAESEFLAKKEGMWPEIINCAESLKDFSDTAALMGCLDLIISVDTSSAHLAGALGRPVWILNRYDSCWRWLKGRVDSPWYPTAKLYQQSSPGDWSRVIKQVRVDLESLSKGGLIQQ